MVSMPISCKTGKQCANARKVPHLDNEVTTVQACQAIRRPDPDRERSRSNCKTALCANRFIFLLPFSAVSLYWHDTRNMHVEGVIKLEKTIEAEVVNGHISNGTYVLRRQVRLCTLSTNGRVLRMDRISSHQGVPRASSPSARTTVIRRSGKIIVTYVSVLSRGPKRPLSVTGKATSVFPFSSWA